jgi:sRNA-binding regulator protein Hfq
VESPNRRLIRPPLAEPKERAVASARTSAKSSALSASAAAKKQIPPDTTNAENFYFVKQMQTKTPMVVVLRDGEVLHGTIEWYDKNCIKLTRDGEPNLLVYKDFIKYLYKESEGD